MAYLHAMDGQMFFYCEIGVSFSTRLTKYECIKKKVVYCVTRKLCRKTCLPF
jgi:hypothetical protein